MKLILFDIDGTLLDSGGAGTRSLNLAFEEIFAIREAFKGISMAGKTDIQILKEGLAKHGMNSANGNIGLLCDSYVRHLRIQMVNSGRHVKPGIAEALDAFSTMDVQLGLLTGNIERGARIKLEPFGLNSYFPLGAFGDDDEDRNRLLPIAAERFGKFSGKRIAYGDCVVIGDTPRDVECAKIHGARSVAVATGPYTYEELAETGAHMVLRTMAEMDYSSLS
ncbi:MAG TPA: HAD family hydrolase [Thermodesulfovibrionales bacterium]|jgi:phosphoglycolate phosphatase-like HAD superfamily hydrolase|nr:HAD family hydrolase [Thermodesulfovibrionales bacterium]